MQSSPVKDSSHTHSPSMHSPRPEQSEGHRGSEQLSPPKSRSHTHSPSTHAPWPEQSSGQRGSEQFLPAQPSSQMQPQRSKLKLPCPLQPGTKSNRPGNDRKCVQLYLNSVYSFHYFNFPECSGWMVKIFKCSHPNLFPASDVPLLILTQVRTSGENPPLTAQMAFSREHLKAR